MRIVILGAGALGSLIGARLSKTDEHVLLLTTDREHVESIRHRGLLVEELDGSIQIYPVAAYDDPSAVPEKPDLIIITVKSYDTAAAVNSITKRCCDSTIFLTLQNGIGNWEQIAHLVGQDSVLLGTTAQGATMLEPGRIRHGGNGHTFIGEFSNQPTHRVRQVVDIFRQANLETNPSNQMQKLIWEKLLINVGINAVTALTGIKNGRVAELEPARDLSKAAVQEALAVAQNKGFAIDSEIVDRVIAVAKATARNRSSMGQDIDHGKQTEIDAINGAIVRFAQELEIPAPVNQTLTRLVQTLEANYLT